MQSTCPVSSSSRLARRYHSLENCLRLCEVGTEHCLCQSLNPFIKWLLLVVRAVECWAAYNTLSHNPPRSDPAADPPLLSHLRFVAMHLQYYRSTYTYIQPGPLLHSTCINCCMQEHSNTSNLEK